MAASASRFAAAGLAGALAIPLAIGAAISAEPLLQLETKVPLGDVRGRIDHMAIDLARHRLFVAALGNDSLAVVDLQAQRLDRLINKLPEPQGVGYEPVTDMLYVANARDGSVRLFRGAELSSSGRIELGSDADNIRVDASAGRVLIGHGDGALTILDAATQKKLASVSLKAHPESFQLDASANRIFVNVPNSGAIDVIDGASAKKIASWPTAGRRANFAMALDGAHQRVLVAFRRPPQLGVFNVSDGALITSVPTCGDVDDLFVDAKRDRVYLSCGDGFIDVLAADGTAYRRAARVPTAGGARTSLFVPELDRLLLAVPARGETAAGIWIYRPSP
ncbi:hypothetical protein [Bradyrhizobium sp. ARR65]|uniref:YncE family protein n=1 Tax=Bradyrhizobium sp. ARR65 TaxID=1040989 RepID=UPI0005533DE8|nr:hypothetical protein [Bradyrhizobium sp. ARR65]